MHYSDCCLLVAEQVFTMLLALMTDTDSHSLENTMTDTWTTEATRGYLLRDAQREKTLRSARTQAGQFSLNHVWHVPPNLPATLAKTETASATISAVWLQLKPGSLVLAAGFDKNDNLIGWWEAIVVCVNDGEFLVRWRDELPRA